MKRLVSSIISAALFIGMVGSAFAEAKKPLVVYFSLHGNDKSAANVDATTSASIVADRGGRQGATEHIARLIAKETGAEWIKTLQTR